MEKEYCTGCERHCDLSNPNCKIGMNQKNNLNLEQDNNKTNTEEKLIKTLRELSHIIRFSLEEKRSQKRILIIINNEGKITQKKLTEELRIKPGSASEIVSKLEHANLIKKIPSKLDMRTSEITLTKEGKKVAEEAISTRNIQEQEMFACLTTSEKESLLTILEKLNNNWQQLEQENRKQKHNHHHHHKHRR